MKKEPKKFQLFSAPTLRIPVTILSNSLVKTISYNFLGYSKICRVDMIKGEKKTVSNRKIPDIGT